MDWYKANKLSLNVDKTVLLRFWPSADFGINVGNIAISNTHCTRYLGVLIDDKLTWKEHTNQLYYKLLTNKCLLLNAKHLLPDFCSRKIYFAHIYSHITYGVSVWGTLSLKLHKPACINYNKNACRQCVSHWRLLNLPLTD